MGVGQPDRAGIEAAQLERLKRLIAVLLRHNRFYGERLRFAGISEDLDSLRTFSERMPFTFKQELVADQQANPPYGTNLTYPIERFTRFNQTSATTGPPMRWLDTPDSWDAMLDNWLDVYRGAGVQHGDRVFFAFSFGPFLGFWTAFEAALKLGCLAIPGGGLSSQARLAAILDNAATVLCCTPTYAMRLAEVAQAENIDLARSNVRRIIVAGEPGGSIPSTRARIEAAWPGARVYDHHGMTEVGPVSFECPDHPGILHIIESSYYAEVIDPRTGGPVEPYGTGELVLTTLTRDGMPLLRYRTGDLVAPAVMSPCACGRYELALAGGILARTDDMILVRGVNIYPSAVEEILRRCDGLNDYRVLIRSDRAMTELEIEVETSTGTADGGDVVQRLEREFRALFAIRVPVRVVPAGSLPRFEMKAKRWVRV